MINLKTFGIWILRTVPALILTQTLFFKFTGAPESVEIFTTLGVEPYGRIGSGIVELILAVLLLIPRTTFYGAVGTVLVMNGALVAHVTQLGFAGEMGSLAALALVTWACAVVLAILK